MNFFSVLNYICQVDGGTTDREITVNTGRQQMHIGLLIRNIFDLIFQISDVGMQNNPQRVKYINGIGQINSCFMFVSFASSLMIMQCLKTKSCKSPYTCAMHKFS